MEIQRLARQPWSEVRRHLRAFALITIGATAAVAGCSREQDETEHRKIPNSAEEIAELSAKAARQAQREADWAKDAEERRDARRRIDQLLGRSSTASAAKPKIRRHSVFESIRPAREHCFPDVNGDGIRDVALWYGWATNTGVAVFDGKNGRRIWATPRLSQVGSGILHCADASTVVAGVNDFTVRAYEATTGQLRWNTRISDEPHRFASGDGCISVGGKDGKVTGLSVTTGSEQPCSARDEPSTGPALNESGLTFVTAGLAVTISAREVGTPMLTLTATKDMAQVWQRELGVFAEDSFLFGRELAYTDRVIVVGGLEPPRELVLLGIDALTGSEMWRRKFNRAEYRPQFVIAERDRIYARIDGLAAIDPITGKNLWHVPWPAD